MSGVRRAGLRQVGFFESCHLQQVSQQADLQWFVAVNGNREPHDTTCLPVDMMAAVDAE